MECKEFRELLTYVGCDKIDDTDIPHRTKATQLVFQEYEKRNTAQKERMKVCTVIDAPVVIKLTFGSELSWTRVNHNGHVE